LSEFACPCCGKEFDKNRFMLSHHKQAHGESLSIRTVKCNICKDDVEITESRYNQSKHKIFYCSMDCKSTGKYVNCDWCENKTYKPPSQIESHENHFCSRDCQVEWQSRTKIEYKCKMCGDVFKWSPSREKEHNPKYCSIKCRNNDDEWVDKAITTARKVAKNNERSALELEGKMLLNKMGLNFNEQVPIADKFLVDVYIPEENIIIQWDGDYWHGHPKFCDLNEEQKKRKRIDKSQTKYLKKCGYTVLRFWETTVYENPDEVIRKIAKNID